MNSTVLLVLTCLFGFWLLMSVIAHIVLGIDEGYRADSWLALACFIIFPPLFFIIYYSIRLHKKIKRNKERRIRDTKFND